MERTATRSASSTVASRMTIRLSAILPTGIERKLYIGDRSADDGDLAQTIGTQPQAVGQIQVAVTTQERPGRVIDHWIEPHHRRRHGICRYCVLARNQHAGLHGTEAPDPRPLAALRT